MFRAPPHTPEFYTKRQEVNKEGPRRAGTSSRGPTPRQRASYRNGVSPPTRGKCESRALTRPPSPGKTSLPRGCQIPCAQVAQLVEHVTENHGVTGSIPVLGTITFLKSIA